MLTIYDLCAPHDHACLMSLSDCGSIARVTMAMNSTPLRARHASVLIIDHPHAATARTAAALRLRLRLRLLLLLWISARRQSFLLTLRAT